MTAPGCRPTSRPPPARCLPQRDGRRVLATPALTGTILPGVTRDSVLQLASGWGECEVQERPITIAEVRQVGGERGCGGAVVWLWRDGVSTGAVLLQLYGFSCLKAGAGMGRRPACRARMYNLAGRAGCGSHYPTPSHTAWPHTRCRRARKGGCWRSLARAPPASCSLWAPSSGEAPSPLAAIQQPAASAQQGARLPAEPSATPRAAACCPLPVSACPAACPRRRLPSESLPARKPPNPEPHLPPPLPPQRQRRGLSHPLLSRRRPRGQPVVAPAARPAGHTVWAGGAPLGGGAGLTARLGWPGKRASPARPHHLAPLAELPAHARPGAASALRRSLPWVRCTSHHTTHHTMHHATTTASTVSVP